MSVPVHSRRGYAAPQHQADMAGAWQSALADIRMSTARNRRQRSVGARAQYASSNPQDHSTVCPHGACAYRPMGAVSTLFVPDLPLATQQARGLQAQRMACHCCRATTTTPR
jgi:hypothetical protein